jgi:hypothetical protein
MSVLTLEPLAELGRTPAGPFALDPGDLFPNSAAIFSPASSRRMNLRRVQWPDSFSLTVK